MATTYIKIGTMTTRATELMQLVRDARNARAAMVQIKETMDSMITGTDYTMVATEFGLGSAADAQTLYNAIAGIKATWEAPDFNLALLTRKVG